MLRDRLPRVLVTKSCSGHCIALSRERVLDSASSEGHWAQTVKSSALLYLYEGVQSRLRDRTINAHKLLDSLDGKKREPSGREIDVLTYYLFVYL